MPNLKTQLAYFRSEPTALPKEKKAKPGKPVRNVAGGTVVDTEARAAINALLAQLRDLGIIEE